MNSVINPIKSWNGKMPLAVSLMMVLGLELFFMWVLHDVFEIHYYDWYRLSQKVFFAFLWMIFYVFCCFVQYFFLIFLRRFLLCNFRTRFYKISIFYLVSFLLIACGLFLFELGNLYILLLCITSWLGILFFFRKIFLKSEFWDTIFGVVLFCIVMALPFSLWGFIILLLAGSSGVEGTNDLIYGSFVGFGMSFIVVPSLVILEYLIKKIYYTKLSDIDKQNFKKYLKLSLMYFVLGLFLLGPLEEFMRTFFQR